MFEKTFEELLRRKHRSTSTTVEISTRIHLMLAAIWTTWPSPAMGTFHQHNFCMTRVFLVVTSSPVVLLGDNMPGLIQRKNRAGWIPWGCCCSLQVVRVIFFHCHVFVAWTPDVAMVRICELALQESFVGTFLARLSIKSKNFLPAFPQRILTYLLFKKNACLKQLWGCTTNLLCGFSRQSVEQLRLPMRKMPLDEILELRRRIFWRAAPAFEMGTMYGSGPRV